MADAFRFDFVVGRNDIKDEALDVANLLDDLPERVEVDLDVDTGKALPEIEKAQALINDLMGTTAEVSVEADTSDAVSELDRVEDELDRLDGETAEVEVAVEDQDARASIDEVLERVDKLDATTAEIVLSLRAEEVGAELGDIALDLAQLDGTEAEVDVKIARAAELTAELEQIRQKALDIGSTPISIDTSRATAGLGAVRDSADQSRSVLANMVGNSAQDLGELGGVAGSAGVALGQLAEYATDGNIALSNLAQVAGPLAAVTIAAAGIQKIMSEIAETRAFRKEQVDGFVDSLREGEDVAQGLADRLREAGEIEFRFMRNNSDVVDEMARLGLTVEKFTQLVDGGKPAIDAWGAALVAAGADGTAVGEVMLAMLQNVTALDEAQRNAAAAAAVFEIGQKGVNDALEDFLKHEDPIKAMPEHFERIAAALDQGIAPRAEDVNAVMRELGINVEEVFRIAASGADDAAEALERYESLAEQVRDHIEEQAEAANRLRLAWEAYSSAVNSTEFQTADLEGAKDALQGYSDQLFALPNLAIQAKGAFDGMRESIKENGFSLDVTTEAGRRNIQALEGVSEVVETKLAAAYDQANGSQEDFKHRADEIALQTLAQLMDGMGLTAEQAGELARQLGLTEGDYEARFELAGEAEAQLKLGLLQGTLQSLEEPVQAEIRTMIAEGDYEGAVERILSIGEGLDPVTRDVEADTAGFDATMAGLASIPGVGNLYRTAVSVDADLTTANADVDTFTSTERETTILVEADPKPATTTVDGFTSTERDTTVDVLANLDPAAGDVAGFVNERRTTTIDVLLGSVPSKQSIINKIGPINITANVTASTRLNGTRDG